MKLETIDMTIAQKELYVSRIAANDAFVSAMNKAIRKGRESARPGTFVDSTPSYGKRLYGDVSMSPCGSPAAMCMEAGGAQAGAEGMK